MDTYKRCLLSGLLCAVLCLCAPRAGESAVFLIGLDGAENALVTDLVKAGRMPNLAALLKDGVQGKLSTLSPLPLSSPVIWTSMATGKSVSKHGISGFVKPEGAGWFRTADRKAPALWNMASSSRKTVGVVGYLMTYPAEAVNGVMVSNNYFMPVGTQSVVFPAGLNLKTSRAYAFDKGGSLKDAARLVGFTPSEMYLFMPSLETYDSQDFQQHYIFEKLMEYAQADEGFARLAEELFERNKFDLFITYLPGIDRVSHITWGRYEAARASAAVTMGGLVPAYYAYTDELIGRVLAGAGKEDTVIIVSDHGFKLRVGAGPQTVISGDHRPGGLFAAKGPAIKSGARLTKPLTDWDIAPTVLYLMGLPAARDMDGKIAEEIFKDGWLSARPAQYIDQYPMPAAVGALQNLPFTPQELERLRFSGYLQ
jgi:predicted AlkP superfamily phosphohydrolase/phosphomutase